MALDQREHIVLDELRVRARDRIVFEAPFAPLCVLAPAPMLTATIGGTRC